MALGCAGAALAAAGCGLTNSSTKIETTTVTRTVTHTVTVAPTTTATTVPPSAAPPCASGDVTATFDVVPGSAGAGNIVYKLELKNVSHADCFVSGLPQVQLLDANRKELPTKTAPQQPGTATAVKAIIAPGKSAAADFRFSPDVTGVGETGNPCEPQASILEVQAPVQVDAKIDPPTSVCSHGAMQVTVFSLSSG